MHEVERLAALVLQLVRRVQTLADLREHVGREHRTELALGVRERLEHARQRLALHVLHREEQLAVDLPVIERAYDVRMIEQLRELRLAQEHLDPSLVSRAVGQEPLQRNDALVRSLLARLAAIAMKLERRLHRAHAAAADHEQRSVPCGEGGRARGARMRLRHARARRRRCEVARGHPHFIVA